MKTAAQSNREWLNNPNPGEVRYTTAQALQVRVERKYHQHDGTVRSATVLVWDDNTAVELGLDVTTGVVGYASDWTVSGEILTYGKNHGPATYGHTDVVLVPALLQAVRDAL